MYFGEIEEDLRDEEREEEAEILFQFYEVERNVPLEPGKEKREKQYPREEKDAQKVDLSAQQTGHQKEEGLKDNLEAEQKLQEKTEIVKLEWAER